MVVQFEDDAANTVEEESVVGNHQQRAIATLQVSLQPFYHLKVQVVGGLVEYQQVGFRQQHVSQCHTLLLTTAQLSHRLLQVANLQFCQHLLGFQHLLGVPLMIKTCIQHRFLRIELWRLFKHSHLQVATEDNLTAVVSLLACENTEQCRFPRTILRNQSYALAFAHAETDVLKQLQGTERLAEMLYVQIRGHTFMTNFTNNITTGMVTNEIPIRSIMNPVLIIFVMGT